MAVIGYDTCEEWYHLKHVGIKSMEVAERMYFYHCPKCKVKPRIYVWDDNDSEETDITTQPSYHLRHESHVEEDESMVSISDSEADFEMEIERTTRKCR